MSPLGYSFDDIEAALGLPEGYTQIESIPVAERLRILRREFLEMDTQTMERIASGAFQRCGRPFAFRPERDGDALDDFADVLNGRSMEGRHPREVFIASVLRRIRLPDE